MNTNNLAVDKLILLDKPGSQRFLSVFAENQNDKRVGDFIRDYESQSRIFSIPRLEAFDINRRKDDLFFGGIPFTSAKWPWPVDSKRRRLYLVAQIDLENASELIQTDLGSGKLQVWAKYIDNCYKGFEKNFDKNITSEDWRLHFSAEFKLTFRTIAKEDLFDEMSIEKISEISSVGDKLFSKYSKKYFDDEDEGLNVLNWQSTGEMYYPSFEAFYYHGELKLGKNKKIEVYDFYEDLEEEFYLALDEEFEDLSGLDVMTSNKLWNETGVGCTLGGYPPYLWNNTFSYNLNILLFFRRYYGDFAITFIKDRKGVLKFSLESHYEDVD
jgi:uncharacterized protein YwqG